MRSQPLALADNLIWTRTGAVWALWRVEPLAYGMRPVKDKQAARMLHQALIRALPGESLWLSVCASLDPVSVVQRMLTGLDVDQLPQWVEECEHTLDVLDELRPGQRVNWIAIPLPSTGGSGRVRAALRGAEASLNDTLGLPRWKPSEKEVRERREQARRRGKLIPRLFKAQPAAPSQMVWLALHTQQRGLAMDDVPLSRADLEVANGHLIKSGSALPDPILDEGGRTDMDPKEQKRFNIMTALERRFLKVIDASSMDQVHASYQVMSVLADLPEDGAEFPGCELLGRIDEFGEDVDWAMRLTVRSSGEVLKANKKALRELNEQFDQRDSEVSLTGVGMLQRAAEDLIEYGAILEKDRLEVETQPTIVFATAGPTAEIAEDRARELATVLGDAGYRLERPVGEQESMWWMFHPGATPSAVVNDYAQVAPSRTLSTLMPFASTELGDSTGALVAANITTGRPGVVLHSIASASRYKNVSGSIAVAGDLGSGKSVLLKTLAGDIVAMGGQVITIDRTHVGEWGFWARSMADAVVVDCELPRVSLDPVRIHGGKAGSRIAQSFLTRLLAINPRDPEGVLLGKILDPNYLAGHGLTGLGEMEQHLRDGDCELDGDVAALAEKVSVFAGHDLGRVIFDPTLPPLNTNASAIVIRTHSLELPSETEVNTPHLYREMSIEKIFGRALYGLSAGLARQVCFDDVSRLALFVVDESHHFTGLTAPAEGREECTVFVRDGRKHNAAMVMGSHDPLADFGDETLRGLIPTRIQLRQRDGNLARRGMTWLDLDPNDEDLVTQLTSDTSPIGPDGVVEEHRRGEGFMRDMDGNIGRIKVLAPASPARNRAARTGVVELEDLLEDDGQSPNPGAPSPVAPADNAQVELAKS